MKELQATFRYDPESGLIYYRRKNPQTVAGKEGTHGYIDFLYFRKRLQAHRLAFILHAGVDPGKGIVSHINGDRTDNRACNLEITGWGDGQYRRRRSDKRAIGVSYCRDSERWMAQIYMQCKHKCRKFRDMFEAICCRKSWEAKIGWTTVKLTELEMTHEKH